MRKEIFKTDKSHLQKKYKRAISVIILKTIILKNTAHEP